MICITIYKVRLVASQYHCEVRGSECSCIVEEGRKGVKGAPGGYVIDKKCASCAAVIGS
jgi:hypothetical protein